MSKQPIELPPGMHIRSWSEGDHNAVYAHWLDSYRDQVYEIPRNWYKRIYGEVLDRLLNRARTRVALAVFDNRPEQIAGFIAYDTADKILVHYVYVKKVFRKHGIGSALLDHATKGAPFHFTFRPTHEYKQWFVGRRGSPSYRLIQKELPD